MNFGVINSQITSAREEYKLGISEDELLRQRIADKAARSNTEGELKWQKRQEKLRGFGETVSGARFFAWFSTLFVAIV